jgi:hypothetical protein
VWNFMFTDKSYMNVRSPNLQSPEMSLNRWMIDKLWHVHTLEYLVLKRKKLLILATT